MQYNAQVCSIDESSIIQDKKIQVNLIIQNNGNWYLVRKARS